MREEEGHEGGGGMKQEKREEEGHGRGGGP